MEEFGIPMFEDFEGYVEEVQKAISLTEKLIEDEYFSEEYDTWHNEYGNMFDEDNANYEYITTDKGYTTIKFVGGTPEEYAAHGKRITKLATKHAEARQKDLDELFKLISTRIHYWGW